MPEYDYEEMKKEAEQYVKFEKDVKNRIAWACGSTTPT